MACSGGRHCEEQGTEGSDMQMEASGGSSHFAAELAALGKEQDCVPEGQLAKETRDACLRLQVSSWCTATMARQTAG